MRTSCLRAAHCLAGLLLCAAAAAQQPAPTGFDWQATLDTAPHRGLVRLAVPGEALARLQSRSAADLRVFDGQDRPVPFALAAPPRPPQDTRRPTEAFRALPLFSAQPDARLPRGAVQLRLEDGAQGRSLWVQLDAATPQPKEARATRLPSALFDTRTLKEELSGLVVQARVPANAAVHFTLASSPDLANWTPVAATGRIYRFDGEGAPANDRLELRAPLRLQDRYLRLDWSDQAGVSVDAVIGLVVAAEPQPAYAATELPAPQVDGPNAREWQLPFATPIAQLDLTPEQANTLVPLRILGRDQPSQPWRVLGHTVVYRLGPAGDESTSPPAVLSHGSMRWLRVEATHGARLDGLPVRTRALFDPVDVVFVAGDAGPYQLAAGRANTEAAALPLAMLAAATRVRVSELPQARIVTVRSAPPASVPTWQRWLPRGTDSRTAGLWLVLVLGVLVLGGVAWSLVKQLNAKRESGN